MAGKPLPQQAAWPSVLPRLLLLVLSFRWYQQRGIGGAGHCPSRSSVCLSGRCCVSVRTHRQTIEVGAIGVAISLARLAVFGLELVELISAAASEFPCLAVFFELID